MHCSNCGAALEPGASFCTSCGIAVQQNTYQQPTYQQPTYQQPTYQQPTYQQPVYQQEAYPQPSIPGSMSWKEFYDRFVAKKGHVTWMTVICFVTSILSFVLFFVFSSVISLIEFVLYLTMGILLLTTKHWACSLIPTVTGGIATVINMANGAAGSGIVAVVVGVICTSTLFKANKAYGQYKLSGTLPTEQF